MFTGIVAGTGKISSIAGDDVIRFVIDFSTVSTDGLVTVSYTHLTLPTTPYV